MLVALTVISLRATRATRAELAALRSSVLGSQRFTIDTGAPTPPPVTAPRASAARPSAVRGRVRNIPFEPSTDLPRWAELGLADPPRDGSLPEQGQTADLLAFALTLPGSEDPVEGIVAAVRVELAAVAGARPSRVVADALFHLERRLDVAMLLLRRSEGRAPVPPEYDPDVPTATEDPTNDEGEASDA